MKFLKRKKNTEQTTLTGNTSTDFRKRAIDHKEQIDTKLSLAIATSTASNRFVENLYFRDFLHLLNPFYKCISRNQTSETIIDQYNNCLEDIKQKIKQADYLSLTIDFWSKDVTGYLGITTNIINKVSKSIDSYCICLDQVPYPHTSTICLNETNRVLKNFGIDSLADSKISYYSKLKTQPENLN